MSWTDDLSVRVARGESIDSLVDYVVTSAAAEDAWPERLRVLTRRFALSFDDARLAVDRVMAGKVRAGNPANEPDRIKDPIAWSAYRRVRGEPRGSSTATKTPAVEREVDQLWRDAYEGVGATRATSSVDVALRLFDRCAAAMSTPYDREAMPRVLLQVATSLSTAAEGRIAAVAETRCAMPGTEAWVDGVELWNASERLIGFFADVGQPEMARRGLGLRGRIVTSLLGCCHAWVGQIMMEDARAAWGDGDASAAASSCDAVILDFGRLVDEHEETEDPPYDEHRTALEHLRDALALRVEIGGDPRAVDRATRLLPRAVALLARAQPATHS